MYICTWLLMRSRLSALHTYAYVADLLFVFHRMGSAMHAPQPFTVKVRSQPFLLKLALSSFAKDYGSIYVLR